MSIRFALPILKESVTCEFLPPGLMWPSTQRREVSYKPSEKMLRGRWQYLYHDSHTRAQELKKFQRLIKFAQALPKLRSTVSRHLRQPDLGKERVLACMVRILSTCFMRPGSQVYASENGSYGIATLRPKHVKVRKDVVEFDFPGKSGVRQQRELKDRQVAKVVKSLLLNPGREVFKYPKRRRRFRQRHQPSHQRIRQGDHGREVQC